MTMTVPSTRAWSPPVSSEKFSAHSILDPVRAALMAAPRGLREPLLIAMFQPDDRRSLEDLVAQRNLAAILGHAPAFSADVRSTVALKVRQACRRVGATYDATDRRWRL